MRTSNKTVSWANCRGGIYTSGFVDGMKDPNGDKDGDGDVDSNDGHQAGKEKVDDFNKKRGKKQQANKGKSQECKCRCPTQCTPSVEIYKQIWDSDNVRWVNEMQAGIGATVTFGIYIGNDGVCRNVTELELTDLLPGCLDYAENAYMYINGEYQGPRPPDSQTQTSEGLQLTWNFDEIPELAPGESIQINFDAETVQEGPNTNWAQIEAVCSYDPSVEVSDTDTATVYVTAEEDVTPPVTTKVVGQPSSECGYMIWPYTPIWLEATDPEPSSGIQYIYYEIAWDNNGDGIWDLVFENVVYQDVAEIHMQDFGVYYGEIELRWYAVDNSDNVEDMNYQQHLVMEEIID